MPRKSFTIPVIDSDFQKSSFSKNNPKTCVLVAVTSGGVAVRDSKDSDRTTLFFKKREWRVFVKAVKAGEFDPK